MATATTRFIVIAARAGTTTAIPKATDSDAIQSNFLSAAVSIIIPFIINKMVF